MKKIAAVTGATGMVGAKIVSLLLERDFKVRVLTRNKSLKDEKLEIVHGHLEEESSVDKLLHGAQCLFHCAAELNDESKMWSTNVNGTSILFESAKKFQLNYICHLSSVGVIGKVGVQIVDEQTACAPLNLYEKTKLESEKMAMNFQGNAKVIVLRPTNIVDKNKNGLISLSRLKAFFKGGEKAHIVHADDVAAAAVYFLDSPPVQSPDCFIVSCDDEKLNTIAGCLALCQAVKEKSSLNDVRPLPHLPWRIPYLLRRSLKGPCNRGDIIYSSQKLRSAGFKFPKGFTGAIRDICDKN